MKPLRESDIQKTILDGLGALHIWAIRMNSGGMFGKHKGKSWAVRFGRKGMADIMCFPWVEHCVVGGFKYMWPTWIEVKKPGEQQTADQVNFQYEVEAEGHRYICVSSWEQVVEALKS